MRQFSAHVLLHQPMMLHQDERGRTPSLLRTLDLAAVAHGLICLGKSPSHGRLKILPTCCGPGDIGPHRAATSSHNWLFTTVRLRDGIPALVIMEQFCRINVQQVGLYVTVLASSGMT